jgi:hypothetical protein
MASTDRLSSHTPGSRTRQSRWQPFALPGVRDHRLWVRVVAPRSLPVGELLEIKIATDSDPSRAVVLRYGLNRDPISEKFTSTASRLLPRFVEPLLRAELEFLRNAEFPEFMDDVLVVNRAGRVTDVLRFTPPSIAVSPRHGARITGSTVPRANHR